MNRDDYLLDVIPEIMETLPLTTEKLEKIFDVGFSGGLSFRGDRASYIAVKFPFRGFSIGEARFVLKNKLNEFYFTLSDDKKNVFHYLMSGNSILN